MCILFNYSITGGLFNRWLPSDLCIIRKYGALVRFDYTLEDFKNRKSPRGDISFLFDGKAPLETSAVFMDNKQRVYQKVVYEVAKFDVDSAEYMF